LDLLTLGGSLMSATLLLLATSALTAAQPKVDYVRAIRPILAAKCLQCHGPDDKVRKAGLRLDLRAAAVKSAIKPGKPQESELIQRITASDAGERMPPAKTGKPLTAAEISLLRRWIEQGAPYVLHWAYTKPTRPPIPEVHDKNWPINSIDNFILARLEREGLRPTQPADRYALVRRLAIDLTGLPPTPEEADRFAGDQSPDAYDRLVDRLLASPTFGERWAQVWLDLARYADSQGYANDPERTIWRWRDWVIQAFNDNLPYDRFTIEQLAGDLLPNPTTSQLIATGFHRNTLTNTEGGTNPEEFRSAAVVDRVNTTFQVWNGLTMGCAQCHSHKYDPFSQKEYYQLYAIFNNSEDANGGNDAPTVSVAFPGMDKDYADVTARLADSRRKLDEETRKADALQPEWEKTGDRAKLPKDIAEMLAKPADKRDAKQKQKLTDFHRASVPAWKSKDGEVRDLTALLARVGTTTPILKEGPPRPTHIHIRGNFQDKGEQVAPGLPALFPPAQGPINRLTLARWLVQPDHPLTARVAVNRLWEEIFGVGIVQTSEDFGVQGELPSHPELLDYLATEYVRLGWDTKKMLKLLVSSSTYRQGSQVTEELKKRDPANRLLARGPRVRLSGEEVRDQALAAAGLLSPKMYGPPVQPPKPSFGLTAAFGGTTDWQTSSGEDRYRRAVYTRVRRNAPYPSLTTFDAPERTFCTVRRLRTNTPLQALVTLNDPVYVEAAQGLARRLMKEGGSTARDRARYAFRLCLIRPPAEAEVKRLADLFESAKQQYAKDPKKAEAMATKPLGSAPKEMPLPELAAWTVVANVLLNLDETLAKR
jgi:mono/diheme cytochrome c family protein